MPGDGLHRAAPGLAEAGRGMVIIDSLTHGAWGCQPAIGQVGKCVCSGSQRRRLDNAINTAELSRPKPQRRQSADAAARGQTAGK